MAQPAAKGSKITLREHFEKVQDYFRKKQKNPKYVQPELVLPELPRTVAYLWDWFMEVQNGDRLTWSEIKAWSEVTLKQVSATEAKAIRSLSFIQYKILNTPPA